MATDLSPVLDHDLSADAALIEGRKAEALRHFSEDIARLKEAMRDAVDGIQIAHRSACRAFDAGAPELATLHEAYDNMNSCALRVATLTAQVWQ